MWDLMSIIAENNRMAIQAMMEGIRLERVRSKIPESWPLDEICKKLAIGPPLLNELIAGFTDIDTLEAFLIIIRRFLPENEEEIMSQRRPDRVIKFCQLFSKRYYPLPAWSHGWKMEDFARSMPVEPLAMSYDAWHDMGMRPGYLALLSLVVYPYEGHPMDCEGYGIWEEEEEVSRDQTLMQIFGRSRVALIDTVQNIVGAIARKIPSEGWTAEELKLMTDGTKYDGVGDFASWAMSETGCVVLDASYEDFEYIEGWGDPLFRWSEYNVKTLTEQWPRVVQIREKIDHIVEWLEADSSRFQELLEFLLEESRRKIKSSKKKKLREYDPTERWGWLDQITEEEMEDDEQLEGFIEQLNREFA